MGFPTQLLRWTVPACLLLPPGFSAPLEFKDVTGESGVTFKQDASKTPQKYLIEAMGAGVAMIDYDADGQLDLYFVNGADLSAVGRGGAVTKTDPRYWNRLYRNLGDWRFEDVTETAAVAGDGYGMGVAVADYDGDGDADLFVTNYGPDLLFRNEGSGRFAEVAAEAGIDGDGWSSGAAFADFDNDGHLDLVVAKYLDWSFGSNRPCGEFRPGRRSYCHPREFGAVAHSLFRNLGNGRFLDVSEESGLSGHPGKGLGVALNDFDADGWVDIFVANDSYPQQLFRNIKGSRFAEMAIRAGAAFDAEGRDYAGMGVVWEDFDGDLSPDLLVNALGRQGYWLYRNEAGRFETVSDLSGIAALSALRSGWGMGLVDFDNDGWRDLFVGQGHVMDDISASDEALAHEEPPLLARNLFGRFYDVSRQAGAAFQNPIAARGVAFGDLDADGRVDAVVSVNDGPALLLRNVSDPVPSMTVQLVGSGGNRNAIGAVVQTRSDDGREQYAFQGSAGSYLSSNSSRLHFGLGENRKVTQIKVRWPDNTVQTIANPEGATIVIRQSEAQSGASP